LQLESPVSAGMADQSQNAGAIERAACESPRQLHGSTLCNHPARQKGKPASTSRQCTSPVKKPSGNIVFFRYSVVLIRLENGQVKRIKGDN
jgi:hypothetical protein